MITRVVCLNFKPERAKEFEDFFGTVRTQIAAFEGCLAFEASQDLKNPACYFTISTWENEDALENYRNSDLFKSTWGRVKPLFSTPAQAWSLTTI